MNAPNFLAALTGKAGRTFAAAPWLGVNGLAECASACVYSIQKDIESRNGLRDIWREIPEDVKKEILVMWTLMALAAIGAALRTAANTEPTNLSDDQQTTPDNHAHAQ